MLDFTFATASTIRFGAGSAAGIGDHSRRLGSATFLVAGSNPSRVEGLVAELPVVGTYSLAGEPTFDDARAAVASARESGADHVIGIGGGAVLDLAKAVAALAKEGGDPLEHAEVIGEGRPIPAAGLPFVAVPTTAGTGSEVTSNSVLTSTGHKVKVSLRSPSMLATVAVVDPELTLSCPADVTMQSGMDALTQCLEPLTSRFANPLVDQLALAGLRAAGRSLLRSVDEGSNLEARTDMAFCSLMGGLSLANAKLGAVHGLAGVLGGVTGAPHGAICAALLEPVTAANIAALLDRAPKHKALAGYLNGAEALTGQRQIEALGAWLGELEHQLDLPGLEDLGLAAGEHEAVVDQAMKASSMKGNPIDLTRDELLAVLDAAR